MRTYERVYTVHTPKKRYRIRVWCKAAHGFDRSDEADYQLEFLYRAIATAEGAASVDTADSLTAETLAEALSHLWFCSGVEILDNHSETGVLIYPEWP